MSAPSIMPDLPDVPVHIVLDHFGKAGRVWRELDEENTSERDVVQSILDEQFNSPVRVVAFNLNEGWCRDVTEDIARAVAELARRQGGTLGPSARALYENATGEDVPRDLVRVD